MANADAPRGLRQIATLHGGSHLTREMQKDASENAVIYRGDVVAREDDSNLTPGGTPGTTNYDGVSQDFGAALLLTNHLVIIDPAAIFEVQANDAGLAEADEGLLANFEFNAGSNEISGHELDGGTEAVTGTLDAKLMRKARYPGNEDGAWSTWEILINRHRLNPGVAGI